MEDCNTRKRVRGKGRVLAKTHINLRLPEEVVVYFKQYPSYTAKMRAVLTAYVKDANKHTTEEKRNG
jgi:uncharacterized protein (DUF4415 family)